MSVKILRNQLTTGQTESIRNHLSFQAESKNQYSSSPYSSKSSDIILFYDVDPEYVRLPFMYAGALTQRFPNSHRTYATSDFKFREDKSLFAMQEEVLVEATAHLKTYGTTTLALYTGFGKTLMGAKIASDLKLITVVVFHREFLAKSWDETFKEFTTAKTWIVGNPVPTTSVDVILCMDTRVHLLPEEFREKVGLLIIDEAHTFCTSGRGNAILAFTPKYIIAETATLERDDGLHKMIHAVVGTHNITRISQKKFNVIRFNTGIDPPVSRTMRGVNWGELLKTISKDEQRNGIILALVKQYSNNKILILTELVDEHVIPLYNMIKQMGENVDYLAGTKKSYSDSRVLIGTYSKIGTGFDEKSIAQNFGGKRIDLLIMATSVKSLPKLEQSVGRSFRSDFPTVIYLVDKNKTIQGHWRTGKPWFISRNATLQEVNMPGAGRKRKVMNVKGVESVETIAPEKE